MATERRAHYTDSQSVSKSLTGSVKQLADMTHHEFGRDSVFTRHEALALVRICEALLLMVGEMTRPAGGSSEEDDEG